MQRSKEQLGAIEAIRGVIRKKIALGELADGDTVGVRTLHKGEDLNWGSIIMGLEGYIGVQVSDPVASKLPGPVPLHLLSLNSEGNDLLVTFLDEDILSAADKIRLNVLNWLKQGPGGIWRGKVMTDIHNLDARRLGQLCKLLEGRTIPGTPGQIDAQLLWDQGSRTFGVHPAIGVSLVDAA